MKVRRIVDLFIDCLTIMGVFAIVGIVLLRVF